MAFCLIVDGYNLIRTTDLAGAERSGGLEAGRRALLKELAAYKRLKGHEIIAVFDGQAVLGPERSAEKGIKTIYTPAGQTADEQIVALARARGNRAVVVTSDQALADAARSLGAEVVSSPEFRDRLSLATLSLVKGPIEEDERPVKPKKGPSKRATKRRRRHLDRLKKL